MTNPNLIPMDIRVLGYLIECDGSAPAIAIPAKLFSGERPGGHPSLLKMGLIEHVGTDDVAITQAGREAFASPTITQPGE